MAYKTKCTVKLHVKNKNDRGHIIFVFGPEDVSIGSDPDCTLQLDTSAPLRAATIRLAGNKALFLPLAGVTDKLGYDVIRGDISAGDVFVIGDFTITIIEICETATNEIEIQKDFKFKNNTLEDTISHFKYLSLSDNDYSMLVQWLEETRDYRQAMHEIRNSLSKAPNI